MRARGRYLGLVPSADSPGSRERTRRRESGSRARAREERAEGVGPWTTGGAIGDHDAPQRMTALRRALKGLGGAAGRKPRDERRDLSRKKRQLEKRLEGCRVSLFPGAAILSSQLQGQRLFLSGRARICCISAGSADRDWRSSSRRKATSSSARRRASTTWSGTAFTPLWKNKLPARGSARSETSRPSGDYLSGLRAQPRKPRYLPPFQASIAPVAG